MNAQRMRRAQNLLGLLGERRARPKPLPLLFAIVSNYPRQLPRGHERNFMRLWFCDVVSNDLQVGK